MDLEIFRMAARRWSLSAMAASVALMGGLVAAKTPEPLLSEAAIVNLLDAHKKGEAYLAIDRLVEPRLPKHSPGAPDPVLDRLFGEVLAAIAPRAAEHMLERAIADRSTVDRCRYQLLLAAASEATGDENKAVALYRAVSADKAASPRQRQRAIAALAQLLLPGDPRGVAAMLRAQLAKAGDPATRWEIELLLSRALRLTGQHAASAAMLETASRSAWRAPPLDAAIRRVAVDQALLAGLRKDRPTLVAMTALSLIGEGHHRSGLGEGFPTCGLDGITKEDFVVVELIGVPMQVRRANLVHASRPGIAQHFLKAIRPGLGTTQSPEVQSMLIRCSVTPRNTSVRDDGEQSMTAWLAARGVYPVRNVDAQAGSLQQRLADREARFGPGSEMLIPVLGLLVGMESTDSTVSKDGEAALRYAERLNALLEAHDAPRIVRFMVGSIMMIRRLALGRVAREAALSRFRNDLTALVQDEEMTPEMLLRILKFDAGNAPIIGKEFREELLTLGLTLIGNRLPRTDARLRTLVIELVAMIRLRGDHAAAEKLIKEYHLSTDICAVQENRPTYHSAQIGSEDYPEDVLLISLDGRDVVEFALDEKGAARAQRVIAERPPFLFSNITVQRAATIRYIPALRNGRATGCVGAMQPVRWSIPTADAGK